MFLLSIIPLTKAHAAMVQPAVWSDTDKIMWGFDRNGSMSDIGCGMLDLPNDTEFEIASGVKPDCLHWWFTSSKIPGEPTLSNEYLKSIIFIFVVFPCRNCVFMSHADLTTERQDAIEDFKYPGTLCNCFNVPKQRHV